MLLVSFAHSDHGNFKRGEGNALYFLCCQLQRTHFRGKSSKWTVEILVRGNISIREKFREVSVDHHRCCHRYCPLFKCNWSDPVSSLLLSEKPTGWLWANHYLSDEWSKWNKSISAGYCFFNREYWLIEAKGQNWHILAIWSGALLHAFASK